jgi:hypothetical protein
MWKLIQMKVPVSHLRIYSSLYKEPITFHIFFCSGISCRNIPKFSSVFVEKVSIVVSWFSWSSLNNYCFSLFDVFTGLSNAAKLLGCSVPQLVIALSTRKIQAGKENIVQRLTLTQVEHWFGNLSTWDYGSAVSYCFLLLGRPLMQGML